MNSYVATTIADLIKEKGPTSIDPIPDDINKVPARSNSQFLGKVPNAIEPLDRLDPDIEVDFLDGDILIIDKSLEVGINDFIYLDTIDAYDDLLFEDSSDLSVNSTGKELFKVSTLNGNEENSNLEDLLISFSNNEDLKRGNSFIF